MYSSSPFNGSLGLHYFQSKVVTLDYEGHRIAVSSHPIDYSKLPDDYVVLSLYRPTSTGQESLPFFEAELNDEPIMVHLDTGKNYSYIYNAEGQYSMSEKPSKFCDASLKIGGEDLILFDIAEVNDMAQAEGLPYSTMIELNSDQIWKNHLLVTFDLIAQKIILRK